MTNILLAVDATNIDQSALDFACYLAKLHHSKLTALFLDNMVANEKPMIKKMHGARILEWDIDDESPEVKEKMELIESNVKCFETACQNRGVNAHIHHAEGVPADEIVEQSRYADILVVDAATSFRKKFEGTPTDFVKDVLKNAECPVIIAPEIFEGIDEIIFTYDGSASSIFAMKQFTYLFPQLDDKKVTVLHVDEEKEWPEQEKKNLGSWLQNHYSSIGFDVKKGDATYEMLAYLFLRRNVFIVMGAYGRNALSRYFKHSHADVLIRTITQPIFIAHH
jgi:nucleotide-binding universal stress UspA family protein